MKIDICNHNIRYHFEDLVPGAVFSDVSETDMTTDKIFIKLKETENNDDENAICLVNGDRHYFNSFNKVFPLKATLTIE